MNAAERALRAALVAKARWMNASGLNQGTSGNLSARCGAAMLITPSATPYEAMKPAIIAKMPLEGEYGAWRGPLKPSTEWRFHLDILSARPEIGAVVHTHSPHATALSILRREIPACHYMVAAFGGTNVRLADYALYGTAALSANALAALDGRTACLLANHGMLVRGATLREAYETARMLETVARQYWLTLCAGRPVLLNRKNMAEVAERFREYRRQAGRAAKDPWAVPSK